MADLLPDYRISKGDSTPLIKIDVEGISPLVAPWTCNMFVVSAADLTTKVVPDKALSIDATNSHFEAYLTKAETGGLVPGTSYIICYRVENPDFTPHPFQETITQYLEISPKLG